MYCLQELFFVISNFEGYYVVFIGVQLLYFIIVVMMFFIGFMIMIVVMVVFMIMCIGIGINVDQLIR